MSKKKQEWSIQAAQQRAPWIMWPLAWFDALLTPRRWAYGIDRVTTAISNFLVVDSTGQARALIRLLGPVIRVRQRLVTNSSLVMRLDWRLRKFVWSMTWASVVALRLWPRKVPIPREEKTIRLIPAPDSYNDFQAKMLLVPNDVPRAELTLLGAMTVQTLHLMQDVYPIVAAPQPPASNDPLERLRGAYSLLYRLVRTPPVWHPQLIDAASQGNLLGALAVGGPFAKLLECTDANSGKYVIDLDYMRNYPVRDGLARLGCRIQFIARDRRLWVSGIEYNGQISAPGGREWGFVERIALCSLVTHSTVWRHGMQYHVAGVAPFAVITQNLPPTHPLRRLLAAHYSETISTNFHTHLTLRRSGFDVTGFSFSYGTILRYYDDGASYFDIARLDPRVDIVQRRIPAELDYPYRTQALMYFEIFESYVRAYIDHYYPTENDLQADRPAQIWFDALDHYIATDIRHYVPESTKANLIKLCALFIYSVTVEHEENTMWNYSVFLPTSVRSDGAPQSVGEVQNVMNFQMVISSAANKLLQDFTHLALDATGARIMRDFQMRLANLQREMDSEPDWYWRICPKDLEASVSA